MQVSEAALGAKHDNVANGVYNLATLYHLQQKYPEAEAAYKRALEIRRETSGKEHLETKKIERNYASLLKTLGREAEAQQFIASGELGSLSGVWSPVKPDRESQLLRK